MAQCQHNLEGNWFAFFKLWCSILGSPIKFKTPGYIQLSLEMITIFVLYWRQCDQMFEFNWRT